MMTVKELLEFELREGDLLKIIKNKQYCIFIGKTEDKDVIKICDEEDNDKEFLVRTDEVEFVLDDEDGVWPDEEE